MANVMFKLGLQSNLDTLIANKNATEGTFYLTKDTHRLYIGNKTADGKVTPVPVNQGIVTVDFLGQLPEPTADLAGEFYYVKKNKEGPEGIDLNVLCVCNGKEWVQVNPQYDDTEILKAISEIDEDIAEMSGTISDLSNEKANLDGATFTGPVILPDNTDTDTDNTAVGKKYMEDYVAEAVKNADVTVGNKFNEIEDNIAKISGSFENYVTKANGEFTTIPVVTITNGDSTTTKTIATTEDVNTAKDEVVGEATDDYNTLGKIESIITALDEAYQEVDASLSASIEEIYGRVSNLENVTDFIGVTTTVLEDEATTSSIMINDQPYSPKNGDVVIYNGDEFVWSEGKWYKFGAANTTNVIIQNLVNRLDSIDAEEIGAIAVINNAIEELVEADSELDGKITGVSNSLTEFSNNVTLHIQDYNNYVNSNNAAVQQVSKDLSTAIENYEKADDALEEALANEAAEREKLAAQLEWGSFDPDPVVPEA